MKSHSVAVCATQRTAREVGEPLALVVVCGHFVQERVVVAQKLSQT